MLMAETRFSNCNNEEQNSSMLKDSHLEEKLAKYYHILFKITRQ